MAPAQHRTGRRRAGTALAVLLLAGCTTQEEPVDRPEGAVALVQNQPTPVGDLTVVVSNVREDGAAVSVVDPGSDAMAEGGQVALGESSTIGGLTFELVDIALADDRGGEPGSDMSTVWILPE